MQKNKNFFENPTDIDALTIHLKTMILRLFLTLFFLTLIPISVSIIDDAGLPLLCAYRKFDLKKPMNPYTGKLDL